MDLKISSLVGYFKKLNTFLVYSVCFHKTVHNKWCLDRTVGQIKNGLERGFVTTLAKLRLNNWPRNFIEISRRDLIPYE